MVQSPVSLGPAIAACTRDGLVRLCHRGLDLEAFFSEAGHLLRRAVPFDGWCWFTVDPATIMPTYHISDNGLRDEDLPRIAQNEYLEEDVNKFTSLTRSPQPVGILSQATGGRPERSARYRDLMRPIGFEAELRAMLVDGSPCWGGMALFRKVGNPDFTSSEATVVAEISRIMAHGVRRSLLASTVPTDPRVDGPGLLLLDRSNSIETLSPAGQRWLDEMIAPSQTVMELPFVVYGVAQQTRLAGSDEPPHDQWLARATVRSLSGHWLVIHGSLLEEGPEGRVAIIIEPARPPELAPLIVEAHGLSERERQIVELVTQGLSTNEIARKLCFSPYTVQDHLKAIFDKTGVRSRRELVAQIFSQHYVPRLSAGAKVGPYGWFVEEAQA